MNELGNHLRQLRKVKSLTVREFAVAIGKSAGYISRIEVRREVPSPELLCVIAAFFDVDPEPLMEMAKETQLQRVVEDIDAKHEEALSLYRTKSK